MPSGQKEIRLFWKIIKIIGSLILSVGLLVMFYKDSSLQKEMNHAKKHRISSIKIEIRETTPLSNHQFSLSIDFF
jgi:hypothetical protein